MRYPSIVLCVLLTLASSQMSHAGVIHVPGDYSTIKLAVSYAYTGDTVLVAPGTYYEYNIWMERNGVVLLGSGADVTIIDGQNHNYPVIIVHGIVSDTTTKISGFTITGGNETTYEEGGGGIHCGGMATIENNVITNNHSSTKGGGLYLQASSIVRNNVISYNSAPLGGGVFDLGFSTITNNVIHHNTASSSGGAIYTLLRISYTQNTIVTNYAPNGSAVFGGNATLLNFENNVVAYQSGGAAVWHAAECIYGSCNDYWSNSGGDVGWLGAPPCQDPTGINGNIKEDPMFCDAGNDDYHLHVNSPCVDAPDCGQIGALYVGCDTVVFFDFEDQNGPISNAEIIAIYGNGVDVDENGIDDGTEEISGSTNAEGRIALAIPVGRDVTIMASTEEHRMEIASFLNVQDDQSESIPLTILGENDYFRKEVTIITPMLTDLKALSDFSFYVAHLDQHVSGPPNPNLIYEVGSRGWETLSSENTEYAILTSDQVLETETVLARLTRIGNVNDVISHMTYEKLIAYCAWYQISHAFGGSQSKDLPICSEFLYGSTLVTVYYKGKYYRRLGATKAAGMWFECLNCAEEYIPRRMELEVSSAGELLVVDAAGRMTGSYFDNGVFAEDKFEIPGIYYSGHGSHPNILFASDTVTFSEVIVQPLATGSYEFSVKSQNGPALLSYRFEGQFEDMSPRPVSPSLLPDSSEVPVAMANFDTLTVDSATLVYLDGTASYDPNGDELFFKWIQNGQSFSQSSSLSRQFPCGFNLIVLEVTDEHDYSSYDYCLLYVSGEQQQLGTSMVMVRDSISMRFLEDAEVIFSGPHADTLFTDGSGAVATRLQPGSYDVAVSRSDYQPHLEAGVEVDTAQMCQLFVSLFPNEGMVSGRALSESTLVPLEGAIIEYVGPESGEAMSSIDGVYRILDLTPGAYTLTATRQGIASGDTASLDVEAGSHTENIDFTFPSFLRGDATGDGTIDVGDVVYLVNYLYRNGDPPSPVEAGDANCDGIVNVADVVYLVNYLFRGGNPPSC